MEVVGKRLHGGDAPEGGVGPLDVVVGDPGRQGLEPLGVRPVGPPVGPLGKQGLGEPLGFHGLARASHREGTGRKPAIEAPLPNRIAELRERTGLSRVELAARVEVNPQTIGYLERGEYNPSLALAFRLGELFRLLIEQVFLRDEPRERERQL